MQFEETPEFQRDLKRLLKKYSTLEDDIAILKRTLSVISSHPQPPISVRIPGIGLEHPVIIKIRKFACKALKGRGSKSGFRLIYAYYEKEEQIKFIEIYFKADQENENRERILEIFKDAQ